MNESSVIINPQPGEVDFERITKMAAPVYTIDQVLKSSPGAVVTTEGYLLINEDEPVGQNCQDGMSKRMLDGNKLYFGESFINVTLWEDMIDFVLDKKNAGTHWFRFINVKVRNFNQEKLLTTTSESTCEVVIDPPNAVPSANIDHNGTSVVRVEQVALIGDYSIYPWCINCSKKMAELSTLQLQRCRACGCTQRVAECQKKVTLNLKLKPDDSNWLTAFENVLSFFRRRTFVIKRK